MADLRGETDDWLDSNSYHETKIWKQNKMSWTKISKITSHLEMIFFFFYFSSCNILESHPQVFFYNAITFFLYTTCIR